MSEQKELSNTLNKILKIIHMIITIIGVIMALGGLIAWAITRNTTISIIMVIGLIFLALEMFVSIRSSTENGEWNELPPSYKKHLDSREKGTINHPLIIDSSEQLPYRLRIENSESFITFQDCDIADLWLDSCQNISLKNSYLSGLLLKSCQNIAIENCKIDLNEVYNCSSLTYLNSTFETLSKIYSSQDVKIEKCSIKTLKLDQTENNTIRFCTIKKIKIKLSKNNVFEGNTMSEKQIAKLSTSNNLLK